MVGSDFVCRKVCCSKKVLVLNPYPQTPFPRKGAECGAAALTPLGATPQTPFLITIEVFRLTEQPFRAVMYIVR